MKRKFTIIGMAVIIVIITSTGCAFAAFPFFNNNQKSSDAKVTSKSPPLLPDTGATGWNWKRSNDDQRTKYCDLITEKLHMRPSQADFFYKTLSATFNTDNNVTLGLPLDETAKSIKGNVESGR